MLRQIVLDTETTGIGEGHRIIEIGCIELIDRKITANNFHVFINPERLVDPEAFKVHGITDGFLKDKPKFATIFSSLIKYIKGAELIIHNAPFDVGFLDREFSKMTNAQKTLDICGVFDTLVLARKKHPGQRNSLDALCKRYGIDNSNRQLHGALLDAELLAWLYLAMTGGQKQLFNNDSKKKIAEIKEDLAALAVNLKTHYASDNEIAAHQAFIKKVLKNSNKDLW